MRTKKISNQFRTVEDRINEGIVAAKLLADEIPSLRGKAQVKAIKKVADIMTFVRELLIGMISPEPARIPSKVVPRGRFDMVGTAFQEAIKEPDFLISISGADMEKMDSLPAKEALKYGDRLVRRYLRLYRKPALGKLLPIRPPSRPPRRGESEGSRSLKPKRK
jgi:hypothetical protein